jgi:hypothetical protein
MIDLTLGDETQKSILPYITVTEKLITSAIQNETNKPAKCQIAALPDLGISSNKTRMDGGFFTGMFVHWTSEIPFVPVDTTVNVCGVYVARLSKDITIPQFKRAVANGQNSADLGYTWNYDSGNHFIMLANGQNGEKYIVLHASAAEYKKQNPANALYPTENCWYADKIKTINDGKRYLRYIVGETAEKFTKMAMDLEKFNEKRNRAVAQKCFGEFGLTDILSAPHYGMPTKNSVAIGANWHAGKSVLLTAPEKDIFIVDVLRGGMNEIDELNLTPHGFGVSGKADFKNYYDLQTRGQNMNAQQIQNHAQKIFEKCPCKIVERLSQICCYNRGKYYENGIQKHTFEPHETYF